MSVSLTNPIEERERESNQKLPSNYAVQIKIQKIRVRISINGIYLFMEICLKIFIFFDFHNDLIVLYIK